MNRIAVLIALGLIACGNENDIVGDTTDNVVPNPPEDGNPVQTDRIVQVQQPQVDVLFIVDNSCSMFEFQQELGNNFPGFMEYFTDSGLDYHIGVISTDMNDPSNGQGKLRNIGGQAYIDEDTNDPLSVFSLMANMGTTGFYDEKGRAAAWTMVELKREIPRNEGFIRDDAAMHFVFISDEEDQSGGNPVSRQEFISWMNNLKATPDLTTAHALVQFTSQLCNTQGTAGTEYVRYANQTNGITFNLCQSNWAPMLDELGLQTAGLKREYFLSKIPVTSPWSLTVKVHTVAESGQNVTLQFPSCLVGEEEEDEACRVTYNPGRNSIVFLDYVPDPFSEVVVNYNIRELFQSQ